MSKIRKPAHNAAAPIDHQAAADPSQPYMKPTNGGATVLAPEQAAMAIPLTWPSIAMVGVASFRIIRRQGYMMMSRKFCNIRFA